MTWDPGGAGVLTLPSGLLVRGRGLGRPMPEGPEPEFAVYLLGQQPPGTAWQQRWVDWPDFRLPKDKGAAREAFVEAWHRSQSERVEVACWGGRGRTGTALACIAVLDGIVADQAVAFVREHYDPRAVETPWQRRFVNRFRAADGAEG